jgi:hypothetical protein
MPQTSPRIRSIRDLRDKAEKVTPRTTLTQWICGGVQWGINQAVLWIHPFQAAGEWE